MTRYNGILQRKSQAEEWALKIERNHGNSERHKGMVAMLRSNWEYIAARPALAIQVYAEVDSTSLGRKGGIIDKLTGGKNQH